LFDFDVDCGVKIFVSIYSIAELIYLMIKVLHVCNGDKFTEPFIELVDSELPVGEHVFFIAERNVRYAIKRRRNVVFMSDMRGRLGGLWRLVKLMSEAEHIVLHGLFGVILYILFLQPWVLKKVHWVIWGGDLYIHQLPDKSWRWRFDELIRKFVIQRIGYLQYWIKGDADLARKWYGAKGAYLECLMYPSNVFEPVVLPEVKKDHLVILVGNSADPSNHHEEVFGRLQALDDGCFHIICPLSYGDPTYGAHIAAEGARIFGSRFTALRDFMDITQYRRMLATVDVAIFAHRRQQGMGNTISLLGLGKKVYMRDDVTPWRTFRDMGIVVHALDTLSLQPPTEEEIAQNRKLVREQFSKEVLVRQLMQIFHGAKGAVC
jgi:dTDP-N-acetylfucosamine:lipid II N-acetylfucosaminyltransferase